MQKPTPVGAETHGKCDRRNTASIVWTSRLNASGFSSRKLGKLQMVALLENGVTVAIRGWEYASTCKRLSQSSGTITSLFSNTTSCDRRCAMPRLTVPTKPRFTGFSSTSKRPGQISTSDSSMACIPCSGLASLMANSTASFIPSTAGMAASMQRRVMSMPRYTGRITDTVWVGAIGSGTTMSADAAAAGD